MDSGGAAIYDTPDSLCTAAQSEPLVGPTQAPCWSMRYSLPTGHDEYFTASPAFLGASYLLMYNSITVYRLRMPSDGSSHFLLVSTVSPNTIQERFSVLGEHRAVLWTHDPCTDVDVSCVSYNTRHPWTGLSEHTGADDDPSSSMLGSPEWSEKTVKIGRMSAAEGAVFDEQSGRVVILGARLISSAEDRWAHISLVLFFA